MTNGIRVVQEGMDVEQASDYQTVLDSRWRFMEVGIEIESKNIVLPATPLATGYQRVNIARHNLTREGRSFVPAFHATARDIATGEFFDGIGADNEWIFIYRETNTVSSLPAITLNLKAQVYNLPILENYLAPVEIAPKSAKSSSRYGLRALDGTDSAVTVSSVSAHGFSVDTRKKILSVHKVMSKKVNYAYYDSASVPSINTSTDVLTIEPSNNFQQVSPPGEPPTGINWIRTGARISYTPFDLSTWPAPLSGTVDLYVIKVTDTTIKLALSEANAQAGIAVDLTTSGSLPGLIRGVGMVDDSRVLHENDYPPSYFMCDILPISPNGNGQAVRPLMLQTFTPLVTADTRYLYFNGVQAVYIGYLAIIILKDPIEVAQ